jgi:hypothetical protein
MNVAWAWVARAASRWWRATHDRLHGSGLLGGMDSLQRRPHGSDATDREVVVVRPADLQPGFLHGVVFLMLGAEHAIRDGAKLGARRLELCGERVAFVHVSHFLNAIGHSSSRRRLAGPTRRV